MSVCPCSKRHSPRLTSHTLDRHHSPPQSWTLADPRGKRTIHTLCANAHRLTHELLNLYVKHDGPPAPSVLDQFPVAVRVIAAESWAAADHSEALPRTVA